jgi:uncharacterized protein YlxP (DUF503 family)
VTSGYVGILDFEIHIPHSRSLKEKRRYVQSTKARLERMLGASVAEVADHELWQRARLCLAVVRREASAVEQALAEAERYLSAQEYELVRASARLLSVEEAIG